MCPADRAIAGWSGAFRTSTFRTACLASAVFALGTLALFAFIYWQTALYEASRIDATLEHEAAAVAREPAADVVGDLRARFADDLHRLTFAAVLSADKRVIEGDLAAYPPGLPADGAAHIVDAGRITANGVRAERVTATARILPDGRLVVVGRSRRDLARLTLVVGRGLAWGLVPALALALAAGIWASRRTMARIAAVNTALERIMAGGLHARLPAGQSQDTLDLLAASVNRMLDELERLIGELRGVGDSIAHDLRTPLARMRARLEGARRRAVTLAELDTASADAIADLDQCLAIITALLRIGELESARRRSGFALVDLTAIVEEAGELYQPMAELQRQSFTVRAAPGQMVLGDRDLLFEVCTNLLDNAIKFAPEGGTVSIELLDEAAGPTLLVTDSGPGIAPEERAAVTQRFYRSPQTSHAPGTGLGLSLVAAILRLHGFELEMGMADEGFVMRVKMRKEGFLF